MPRTATKSKTAAPAKSASKGSASKGGASKGSASKSAGSGKSAKASQSQGDQSTLLKKYFLDSLKDIYWAEKAGVKALPRLVKAATTQELKQSFEQHIEVTREQVGRLEQVFELMGAKAQAKKCEAMDGLIKESESIIEETEKGSLTRDVALIMAAQKMEHYEIASYGGLAQLARTLGLNEAADLLGETLSEEKEADQLLTGVAENNINVEASEEDEEEED
jgi:ferritin-like metal-binding protein YciE